MIACRELVPTNVSTGIGKEAKDAAWYYPEPKTDKAAKLKDHVAFCKLSW